MIADIAMKNEESRVSIWMKERKVNSLKASLNGSNSFKIQNTYTGRYNKRKNIDTITRNENENINFRWNVKVSFYFYPVCPIHPTFIIFLHVPANIDLTRLMSFIFRYPYA